MSDSDNNDQADVGAETSAKIPELSTQSSHNKAKGEKGTPRNDASEGDNDDDSQNNLSDIDGEGSMEIDDGTDKSSRDSDEVPGSLEANNEESQESPSRESQLDKHDDSIKSKFEIDSNAPSEKEEAEDDDDDEDSDSSSDKDGEVPENSQKSPAHENQQKDEKEKEKAGKCSDDKDDDEDSNSEKDDSESEDEEDSDSSDDEDDDKEEDGSENGEEKKVPTDEYGRPLSAYEIMRLERIKRNKAYLAQLGLEADKKNGNKGTLLAPDTDEKPIRKRAKRVTLVVEPRSTMSRRTKGKRISYSEPTVADFKLPVSERGKKKEKKDKHKVKKEEIFDPSAAGRREKRENRVPLFIYQELRTMETNRRQALRRAEKIVARSERELDIFNNKLEVVRRKEQRIHNKEAKKALGPIVEEIQRRRNDIIRALRSIDDTTKSKNTTKSKKTSSAEELREQQERVISWSQQKYPKVIEKAEQTLGKALLKRLPPFEDFDKAEDDTLLKKKSAGVATAPRAVGKASKGSSSIIATSAKISGNKKGTSSAAKNSCSKVTSSISLPTNMKLDELKEIANKSKRRKKIKSRNVGGPVTEGFSSTVQRKWVEGDIPTAPTLHEYVPQSGDTVLYYPCAHYNFLRKNPDIPCKKNRLQLRRPLWQRAVDEKKTQEEMKDEKKDDEEAATITSSSKESSSKEKTGKSSKPWFTMDWISTLQSGAGQYPIMCRVERVVAEYPYDAESMSEIRKFNYQQKVAKETGREVKEIEQTRGRLKPTRKKPPLALSVTLKALAPITPPIRRNGKFVEDEDLSLPPMFSVLTFPCDNADQFVLPFAFAFRSHTLSIGNSAVKITDNEGSKQAASLVAVGNEDVFDFDLFRTIIKKYANAEIDTIHKIDTILSKGCESGNLLPEGDLRAAIQTILYLFHMKSTNMENAIMNGDESRSISSKIHGKLDPVSLVSNITGFVRTYLPRWNSIRIKKEGVDKIETVCPWQLSSATDDDNCRQDSAITAAFAPRILIASSRKSSAGLVYSIDESLRSQVEMFVKYMVHNDDQAILFVSPVTDEVASEYSRFVPLGMCFKKILKRLKLQRMKQPRHHMRSGEDLLEDQNFGGEIRCCYYRSISSILSDVHDIFENCLLYNSPESDIVHEAYSVTTLMKVGIEKLAEDWSRDQHLKRKKEMINIKNAESVARGELGMPKSSKHTSSAPHNIEDFSATFEKPLSRDWMNVTSLHDAGGERNAWLPQCGDKVIYNRILHGKFINGHLDSLAPSHRSLPAILPPSGKKRKKIAESVKKKIDMNGQSTSDVYQYWLGTVSWIRPVFPNPDMNLNGEDEVSPILAIGIKFHYRWLANRTYVVYWKPCVTIKNHAKESTPANSSEAKISGAASHCKCCGLSLHQSFLSPAWDGPIEKILPPFPVSAGRIEKPSSQFQSSLQKIDKCLNVLKTRVIEKSPLDAFEPNGKDNKPIDIDRIPERYRHIFEEDNSVNQGGAINILSPASQIELNKAYFNSSWIDNVNSMKASSKATRAKSSMVLSSKDGEMPFHERIMANPYLCLELIHQRVSSGYYRCMAGLSDDIREAFVSNAIYVVKERILSKRLKKSSESTVFRFIVESIAGPPKAPELDLDKKAIDAGDLPSDSKQPPKQATLNLADLNLQERTIVTQIQTMHKLHSMALAICMELPVVELSLGLRFLIENEWNEEDNGTSEQDVAKRNANAILSSLAPDKMKFRKYFPSRGPKPNVLVKLKLRSIGEDTSLPLASLTVGSADNTPKKESDDIAPMALGAPMRKSDNEVQSIVLEPDDYKNNRHLARLFGYARPQIKVGIFIEGSRYAKKSIFIEPHDYESNESLRNIINPLGSNLDFAPVKVLVNCNALDEEKNPSSDGKNNSIKPTALAIDNEEVQRSQHETDENPEKISLRKNADETSQKATSSTKREVDNNDLQSSHHEDDENPEKISLDKSVDETSQKASSPSKEEADTNDVQSSQHEADEKSDQNSLDNSAERISNKNAPSSKEDILERRGELLNEGEVDLTKTFTFFPSDYENNTPLIRALFCRSKRRSTCARCVLKKGGLFSCRVQSAHSNLDYDWWLEYLKKVGGVSGLLTLINPKLFPAVTQDESRDSLTASIIKDENDAQQENTAPDEDDQPNPEDAVSNNAPSGPPIREIIAKATHAIEQSREILKHMTMVMSTPVCLGDNFMKAHFTVDPDDGHFEICQLCGLGGEVICCESCPTVSHSKCAGIEDNLDEDWHCFKCKEKKANNSATATMPKCDDSGLPSNYEESIAAVTTLLDDLKALRVKPQSDEPAEAESAEMGSKIMKEFDDVEYVGVVVELPSKNSIFYRVEYEDGDNEDFTLEEILPFINAYNKMGTKPDVAGRKDCRQSKSSIEESSLSSKRTRKKSEIDDEEEAPRKRRRISRTRRYVDSDEETPVQKKVRGRPRKRVLETSPVPKKKARGRPRKRSQNPSPSPEPAQKKSVRGRPKKRVQESSPEPSPEIVKKKGRGRPRKKTLVSQSSAETAPKKRGKGRSRKDPPSSPGEESIAIDLPEGNKPTPGHIDKDLKYYCTKENDTSVSIAKSLGCTSWLDIAYIPENLERFPALQNKKTKFRSGTFVRIADAEFVIKKAMALVK